MKKLIFILLLIMAGLAAYIKDNYRAIKHPQKGVNSIKIKGKNGQKTLKMRKNTGFSGKKGR